MRLFGLIGYPLTHSFSKKYFTEKFKRENLTGCTYENFEIEKIELLQDVISNNPELIGLNVTIPYKTDVIALLDELSEEAKTIGAVNTIRIENREGKKILKGFNTDAGGFEQSLIPLLKPLHTKALIIGTGGAAQAVAYVLSKLNIDFLFVSRNKLAIAKNFLNVINFEEANEKLIEQHKLIINATPSGTYPNIETFPPLPYHAITQDHLAYDLVYNPGETIFLSKAKQQGATIKNGLEMLHLQAEQAWEIWNGRE